MINDLRQAVRDKEAILFVGAGVSAALGAPTWSRLIDSMGTELGFDADVFRSMSSSYLTLAEYYKMERGSIGPLRSWMDKNWNVPEEKIRESRIHQLIVELDFPTICTTNYDSNIETAYKAFGRSIRKVVDVRDLLPARSTASQIIKLHGDFDDDESIVLTETDYFNRLAFESPLDIRLRSDVLARPVIFIGYSLSDINVRLLLHKLWRIWDSSLHRDQQPKSYVFLPRPNPIEERVLGKWGVITVVGEEAEMSKALEKFLEDLR